jgi:RHS repeat-associated protein
MDVLTYNYLSGTNKLRHVDDTVPPGNYSSDLDDQEPDNYTYDGNGSMQQDIANGIGFVIYDMHNMPVTLYKTDGTQYQFAYDADGNRVRKAQGTATYPMYFNGADGKTEVVVPTVLTATHNILGNDMVGQVKRSSSTWSRYYYLKDHLGNIRVTVNASGGVENADDYYPFGMQMEGRSVAGSADGRYKFTGKERDVESGYDYFGARYYDARIGKWLSVDPLAEKYPNLSPFNYVANNPLRSIDPDGKGIADAVKGGWNAFLGSISPSFATPPSEYYNGDRGDYRAGYVAVSTAILVEGTKATAGLLLSASVEGGAALFTAGGSLPVAATSLAGAAVTGTLALNASGNLTAALLSENSSLQSGSTNPFDGNNTPKASEVSKWAEGQGWTKVSSETGPTKYVDQNGVVRVTIKKGSSRTPGSEGPHVEVRNSSGKRIDPRTGKEVTRRSDENHTSIEWDIE